MIATQRSEPGAPNLMLQAADSNKKVEDNTQADSATKKDAAKKGHARESSFGNKDFAVAQNDIEAKKLPAGTSVKTIKEVKSRAQSQDSQSEIVPPFDKYFNEDGTLNKDIIDPAILKYLKGRQEENENEPDHTELLTEQL